MGIDEGWLGDLFWNSDLDHDRNSSFNLPLLILVEPETNENSFESPYLSTEQENGPRILRKYPARRRLTCSRFRDPSSVHLSRWTSGAWAAWCSRCSRALLPSGAGPTTPAHAPPSHIATITEIRREPLSLFLPPSLRLSLYYRLNFIWAI